MSESTEAIRANIDRTRAELGQDVDALADKVTPSKIVQRQTGKLRGALGSVRDKVMGVADDAGSTLGSAGSSAGHGLGHGVQSVKSQAQGNPLAVGLIAFGVGLLAASLVPASSAEKKIAASARDGAQPLIDEAAGVAREVGEHLKEPAQEAVETVKATASEAVEHVRDEATHGSQEVAGTVRDARDRVAGS